VSRSDDAVGPSSATPVLWMLVTGLFFLSGSAGLVYQVLWMRSLGLFFGSDMYGVSIILGTFMGGLALGSLLGGRLAERSTRPLLWYGLAELGIGLFALRFSALLAFFEPLLRAAYAGGAGGASVGYQVTRIGLACGVLLLPTTLMGATLPLILKHFVRSRSVLGAAGAYFYAVNTLGALVGTLVAGFALLPYLGMARSTAYAVGVNWGIGVVCCVLGWLTPIPSGVRDASQPDLDPLPGFDPGARARLATAALVAFGVSGFGSFALEVAWTRTLLISFSATVYSFSATLACFLFGIFLGSRLVSSVVDRHENPLGLFAQLELGVAASVAALGLLLHVTPGVFGRLLAALAPRLGDHALVVSTLLVSFPLLVLPATLLGATFPVALRIYTTSVARVGSRSGEIYASNTIGAVLGSLCAGFILIPRLGASTTIALLALLFLAVGAGLARVAASSARPAQAPRAIGLAVVVTLLCSGGALLLPYRPTLNFDQASLADATLLYHAEGVQNTIDVVRAASGATSLIIGGNVEADDGYRQRRHFVLKGHLPLMLLREPKSVLVVGLGMGITLQATARHPGLERIDVVELSPDIVRAQSQLTDVNGDVLANPLVHVRIDDGRLFMKMTSEHFDMITADPIHPKISRVGYLYTREYYEAIRSHLTEGGVVCQWMPVYQIAPRRLRSAIKTFLEVFPRATLWYVEGHALLIARRDSSSIDYGLLKQKFENPEVREDLASIHIESPEQLLTHLRMGPDEIRAYVDDEPDVPLNTDDYPYLEYFVPRDLFYTTADNVRELSRHVVDPAQLLVNVPGKDTAVR
jgi:spermidine synthase